MKLNIQIVTAAFLILAPVGVNAQSYPERPIRIIVPAPAGGVSDMLARVFADYFSEKTGQPAIVENRGGAGGNLAWEGLAKSPADGYTIGIAHNGIPINRATFKSLRFDLLGDFAPVAIFGLSSQIIFINDKLPVKSVEELVTYSKSQSRRLSYGSGGPGSPQQLAGDQLARRLGIEMTHVPYRGLAPAATDLAAGHIDMLPVSIGPVRTLIDAKMVRPLLSLTARRLPYLPQVPTAAEVGLTGLEMSNWFGLLAPKGTPPAIVERLNQLARTMLADAAIKKRMEEAQLEEANMTVAEFESFVKSDAQRWEQAVRDAGLYHTQ